MDARSPARVGPLPIEPVTRAAQCRIGLIARKSRYGRNTFVSGNRIADFQSCVAAYKFFESQAKIEAGDTLFSAQTIAPGSIMAPDDFFDNRNPNRPCRAPQQADLRKTR